MDHGSAERGRPKVVSITKGLRLRMERRPSTRPACPIWPFSARIPQIDRAITSEGDIYAELRRGDPDLVVLRKCRYVIENAESAFPDRYVRERTLSRIIALIGHYGEVEGVPLAKEALERYGDMPSVRRAVSSLLSNIGGPEELGALLGLLKTCPKDPVPYMAGIVALAERFPEISKQAADSLRAMEIEGSQSFIAELDPGPESA